MAYEQPAGVPRRNEADRTGERTVSEEGLSQMKPTVASAVRSLRDRMPALRPNGIFRHPNDWTQEELDFIADSLKMNVPIYTIANMVHCEKHTLSTLISKTPELRELREQKYDNLLEEAEYQADRLMKAGNSSLVIYVLQTLGRKKGWTTEDAAAGGKEDESRIVMGIIPDEEVKKAEEDVKAVKGGDQNPAGMITDPVALAAVEGMVKEEVAKRTEEMKPKAIDVDSVSKPKYEQGESVTDVAEQRDFTEYGAMGMGASNPSMGADADPWSDGANSMFFQ